MDNSQKIQAWFNLYYKTKDENSFNIFYKNLTTTNPPEDLFSEEVSKRYVSTPSSDHYWKNRYVLWGR
jgi:hypothetical protein